MNKNNVNNILNKLSERARTTNFNLEKYEVFSKEGYGRVICSCKVPIMSATEDDYRNLENYLDVKVYRDTMIPLKDGKFVSAFIKPEGEAVSIPMEEITASTELIKCSNNIFKDKNDHKIWVLEERGDSKFLSRNIQDDLDFMLSTKRKAIYNITESDMKVAAKLYDVAVFFDPKHTTWREGVVVHSNKDEHYVVDINGIRHNVNTSQILAKSEKMIENKTNIKDALEYYHRYWAGKGEGDFYGRIKGLVNDMLNKNQTTGN